MTFDLEYLRDNGTLRNWPTLVENGCQMGRWKEDDGEDSFSVLDANGKPLGWGETKEDAIHQAQYVLTCRQRQRDGVVPAKVCDERGAPIMEKYQQKGST